jgi:hypothetical protein
MQTPLTDEQLAKMTDYQIPIMLYSDLIENGVINSLMQSPCKCVIFLVRQEETSGHWCLCFMKEKGSEIGVHVYDPYGNPPDSKNWKKYVKNDILESLHQEQPYLLKELYNSGYNIYFNEFKHQKKGDNIQTCGKHCILRSCFLDLDTDEYNELLKRKCESMGVTPDELVCIMTDSL